MRPLLLDIERRGRLPEAWLADPVSNGVRDWYHWRVMGDGDGAGESAYAKLRAYEVELTRIRETLVEIGKQYTANEDGIVDRLGRA